MLEHPTGVIGLPLRLLAREIYDRVCALRGSEVVALVTGEEKRVPRAPRYWVCTVEAMPSDLEVDFVAVDEIQLVADRQRGHIFTERLLRARGRRETCFLGAGTARGLIEDLVPTAERERLERLSSLRWTKPVSIGALRPRSAVVAFRADDVYSLAERIRVRRGGAAVVLGALSPRTRNAQVAMYQAGEVDYLVATDAIGMGLNMDVDHVVFASTAKFDGREHRPLAKEELAQIAGRAGRNQRDGDFCTLSPASEFGPDFSPAVIRALESHDFAPLRRAWWRNPDLDFRGVDELITSLKRKPPGGPLRAAPPADDLIALETLARMQAVRDRARGPAHVELLWRVCQVPDFRKLLLDRHAEMLAEVYVQLTGPEGRIDTDWMARRIERIDDTDGSIDLLMTRMAFIRTWTYITGHRDWVRDAQAWQERTHAIEDRLSDALHEALVHRFVRGEVGRARRPERPSTTTPSRRSAPAKGTTKVAPAPDSPFAKLVELRDELADETDDGNEHPDAWAERLVDARHADFELRDDGVILFETQPVGRLKPGPQLHQPDVAPLDVGGLPAGLRARVSRRLVAVGRDVVEELLAELRPAEALVRSDAERGLLHALATGLGTASLHTLGSAQAQLGRAARARLGRAAIRVGPNYAFALPLLRPAALRRRALLCASQFALGPLDPAELATDAIWRRPHPELDPVRGLRIYEALGYIPLVDRIVRVDRFERAAAIVAAHDPSRGPLEASALHLALGDPWESESTPPELDALAESLRPPPPPRDRRGSDRKRRSRRRRG